MVATSFWGWKFTDEPARLRALLEKLLTPDGDIAGYVRRSPEASGDSAFSSLDPREYEAAVERLYANQDFVPDWVSGSTAEAGTTIDGIVARLHKIGEDRLLGRCSLDEAVAELGELKIRVFLPSERACSLFGDSLTHEFRSYSVCLDLAFSSVLVDSEDQALCLISASVWSDHPYSRRHAHAPADRMESPRFDLPQAKELAEFYLHNVRSGIRQVLEDHLDSPALPTVQNTPYVAPVYWVVSGNPEASAEVVAHLLKTTDLDAARVSGATLAGTLTMYRRMLGDSRVNVPFYVLVPDLKPNGVVPDERESWFAEQEENAAIAVLAATELELQVATLAFDIDTDLSLWEHNLQLYGDSTVLGAALWDAVAMHLPVASHRDLDRAHRIIALIHQTLLQSVSDLAYVTNKVQDTSVRLSDTVADLQVKFDQRIAENRRPSANNSAALSDGGYLGLERRRIDSAVGEIDRIKGNFQGLFDAITKAFDERRTRETDRFSRSNLVLATTVAVFGLVTVLTATFKYSVDASAGYLTTLQLFTWLLGLAVLFAGGYVVLVLRGRRLGNRGFRQAYKPLRDYLRKVSTAELQDLKRRLDETAKAAPLPDQRIFLAHAQSLLTKFLGGVVELGPPRCGHGGDRTAELKAAMDVVWDALDHHLSQQLIIQWKRVLQVGRLPREENPSRDLGVLENNVGAWAMHTMLVNERPPELYKYNLPRLIALYCALSATDPTMERNAVARVDVGFVVDGLEFGRPHVAAFYQWLTRRRQGIDEVVRDIDKLGLHNGMTNSERTAALKEVYSGDAS